MGSDKRRSSESFEVRWEGSNVGGYFGVASKQDCVADLFYGTDYHSHLGTSRGGMVVYGKQGFKRNIHDITNTPFRTKFEHDLSKHRGQHGPRRDQRLRGPAAADRLPPRPLRHRHRGAGRQPAEARRGGPARAGRPLQRDEGERVQPDRGRREPDQPAGLASWTGSATCRSGSRDPARSCCSPTTASTPRGIAWAARRWCSGARTGPSRRPSRPAPSRTSATRSTGTSGRARSCGSPPTACEQLCAARRADADLRVPLDLLRLPGLELRGDQRRGGAQPLRRRAGPGRQRRRSTSWPGFPTPASATPSATPRRPGIPYRRPFVKYTPTWPRSFMPQDQRVRDLVAPHEARSRSGS